MVHPLRKSGTSSRMIFTASPSAIAVLPTPGSPTRITLLFVLRASTCAISSSSVCRPMTGSILPSSARALRLVQSSSMILTASSAPRDPRFIVYDSATTSFVAPNFLRKYAAWLCASFMVLNIRSRMLMVCLPLNNTCVNARLNTRSRLCVFLGESSLFRLDV